MRIIQICIMVLLALLNFDVSATPSAATTGALAYQKMVETNPNCMRSYGLLPDPYTLGTGTNFSGACSAFAEIMKADKAVTDAENADASLFEQSETVAQQILTVQNLTIQTQELIKDIEEHPLQVIVPDVNQIIRNQQRIAQLTHDIDTDSSKIGSNAIKDLQLPDTIGLGQGSRFQLWEQSRKQAIQSNFDTIQSFMGDMKDENKSLTAAIKNLNGAKGQRANAQALSNAAGQQLNYLSKIEELLFKSLSLQSADSGQMLEEQAAADALQKATDDAAKKGTGVDTLVPTGPEMIVGTRKNIEAPF